MRRHVHDDAYPEDDNDLYAGRLGADHPQHFTRMASDEDEQKRCVKGEGGNFREKAYGCKSKGNQFKKVNQGTSPRSIVDDSGTEPGDGGGIWNCRTSASPPRLSYRVGPSFFFSLLTIFFVTVTSNRSSAARQSVLYGAAATYTRLLRHLHRRQTDAAAAARPRSQFIAVKSNVANTINTVATARMDGSIWSRMPLHI